MITFVVDGATYRYVQENDWRDESASFSHRGGSYPPTLRITGDNLTVWFLMTVDKITHRGWWTGNFALNDVVCERSVRLARSRGVREYRITDEELSAIYFGPHPSLTEELAAASRALPAADFALVKALLAIGCTRQPADPEARLAIRDWVASHADALAAAPLATWLAEPGLLAYDAYCSRSAMEFLLGMCREVELDLRLDTTAWDAQLATRDPYGWRHRPWGIPEAHWWWRQGRRRNDGGYWYPHDED